MINLTDAVRKSNDVNPLFKFCTYLNPETYYAENMKDYLKNSPKIKINWNNRLGKEKLFESFYVYIPDIDLMHLRNDMFEIYDKSGFCIAFIRDNIENKHYSDFSVLEGNADLILLEHRPHLSNLIYEIYKKSDINGKKIKRPEKAAVKLPSLESLIPGFCPA